MHCNSYKRDTSATDFLRSLYREGELSRKDLTGRLTALRALAAGKLRPQLSGGATAASEQEGRKHGPISKQRITGVDSTIVSSHPMQPRENE
jgi:hypothetical protein